MKFLRRVNKADYITDQVVSIGAGGGSDTVEDVPNTPSEALEIEIDGKRYVILAYETQS